ncbi:MAG TPA: hypothetical protein VEU29_03350 [Actinomycetota bacterium]|nr:hypothetical protein [Actinomycetota bacterium]
MANLKSMTTTRKRICSMAAIVLSITLLQAVAGPLTPAAASVRPRHRLGGVTKIVGDGSAWMRIRLTTDVDPHAKDEDQPATRLPFRIRGDGRLVAAVLTQEAQPGELGSGPSLTIWSLGRCAERACETSGFRTSWMFSQNLVESDGRQVLPAGDYRLYFIADGAPARVRIDLADLSGYKRLSPSRPVQSELRTLAPLSVEDEEEGSVYYGGRHAPFEGSGFALAGLWLDGEGSDTQAGSCIYETRTPPPGQTAFAPPCPAADVSSLSFASSDYNEIGYFSVGALPLAMGLWRKAAETTQQAGGVTVWVTF